MADELVTFQLAAMDKKLDKILVQVEATNGRVDEAEKNIIRLQERAAGAEQRANDAEKRADEAETRARQAEERASKPHNVAVIAGSIASAVAAAGWAAWERFGK